MSPGPLFLPKEPITQQQRQQQELFKPAGRGTLRLALPRQPSPCCCRRCRWLWASRAAPRASDGHPQHSVSPSVDTDASPAGWVSNVLFTSFLPCWPPFLRADSNFWRSSFSFSLRDFQWPSAQGRATANQIPGFCFVWESLYFSLAFEI